MIVYFIITINVEIIFDHGLSFSRITQEILSLIFTLKITLLIIT